MFSHPLIKGMKEQHLSQYTIVESNFLRLTEDVLIKDKESGESGQKEAIKVIHGMLEDTKHQIELATYNLSKLVDNGDFHIELQNERSVNTDLIADIPRCFKITLKEMQAPVTINVKYLDGHHVKQETEEPDFEALLLMK